MTEFEKEEISQHERIYTIGTVRRKNTHKLQTPDGIYKFEPGEAINWRYEALSLLDKDGSFGIVIKAKDHKTKSFVAIKLSRRGDESFKSEIEILRRLMKKEELSDSEGYESIVQMVDHF